MLEKSSVFSSLDGPGKTKVWVRAHLDYPDKEWCLIWPFFRGEGTIQIWKNINVFRIMCEYRNGPAPTPDHQAAHSCGRRHDGCVNPHHLSWKTNSENQIERYQHSGAKPTCKLTPEQVDAIVALKDRAKIPDIAKQFGVSCNNIRSIHAGRLWRNTSSRQRRAFSDDEVLLIRTTSREEKSARQLAEDFGVSVHTIRRIRDGTTHKWVNT